MNEPKLKGYLRRRWIHFVFIALIVTPLVYNGHIEIAIFIGFFLIYLIAEEERNIRKLFYDHKKAHFRSKDGKKVIKDKFNILEKPILTRALKEAILEQLNTNKEFTNITVILRDVYDASYENLIDAINSAETEIANNSNKKADSIFPPNPSTEHERANTLEELNIIKEFCKNGMLPPNTECNIRTKLIVEYLAYLLDTKFSQSGYENVYKAINNQLHLLHVAILSLDEVIRILDTIKDRVRQVLEDDVYNTKFYIEMYLIEKV